LLHLNRLVWIAVSQVRRMSSLHPLVFSGPSGSGKSTLVQRLMKEYPDCFAFSVSRKTLLFCVLYMMYVYIKWIAKPLATSFITIYDIVYHTCRKCH